MTVADSRAANHRAWNSLLITNERISRIKHESVRGRGKSHVDENDETKYLEESRDSSYPDNKH